LLRNVTRFGESILYDLPVNPITLYGQYLIGIVDVNTPFNDSIFIVHERSNFRDAMIAVYVSFEFQFFHYILKFIFSSLFLFLIFYF